MSERIYSKDEHTWPKGPIGMYAYGDYMCRCKHCRISYSGDKRSSLCYPCAVEDIAQKEEAFNNAKKANGIPTMTNIINDLIEFRGSLLSCDRQIPHQPLKSRIEELDVIIKKFATYYNKSCSSSCINNNRCKDCVDNDLYEINSKG